MKEINIARAIVSKRREKGITQEDLAKYIGISKASVSKWETGQSYPDITLLPQLAAYFNISIDELMAYEPQMTKEDIRKLYRALSSDFYAKPLDEVLNHCREIAKEYFSCVALLFQIGSLFLNHCSIADDADKAASIIAEAKELFIRVKNESDDVELSKQALCMEAACAMALGHPNEALELLEGTDNQLLSTETLLASAYRMTGKTIEAKTVLQVGAYKSIIELLGIFTAYLPLCADEPERHEEVYTRAIAIAETFDIMRLHPAPLMTFYIAASQSYLALGNEDRALDLLEKYTDLVTGDIYPLRLKGDDFFDLLDGWLDELALGTALPRDENTIRQSMLDAIASNPALSELAHERRFHSCVQRLKNNC